MFYTSAEAHLLGRLAWSNLTGSTKSWHGNDLDSTPDNTTIQSSKLFKLVENYSTNSISGG